MPDLPVPNLSSDNPDSSVKPQEPPKVQPKPKTRAIGSGPGKIVVGGPQATFEQCMAFDRKKQGK